MRAEKQKKKKAKILTSLKNKYKSKQLPLCFNSDLHYII